MYLPDSLEEIKDRAFLYCEELETIRIGKNLESLSAESFNSCKKIARIEVDEENECFMSINNILFTKDGTELVRFPASGIGEYYVPYGVTRIWEEAFYRNDSLSQIVLPDSVEQIGESAFIGCNNLEAIFLGSGISLIEDYAFSISRNFVITYYAGSKEDWESVLIGAGNEIFADESFSFECSVRDAGPVAEGSCGKDLLWTMDGGGVLRILGKGYMDSYTASSPAPWDGFRDTIQTLVLEGETASIGSGAFQNCTALEHVYIRSEKIEEIGAYAFAGCGLITRMTFSPPLTTIGEYAFSNCSALKKLTLPKTLFVTPDQDLRDESDDKKRNDCRKI